MIIQCIVASACAKKGYVSQNIHVVNMVKLWIHSELICTETSALLKYTLLCSFLETYAFCSVSHTGKVASFLC